MERPPPSPSSPPHHYRFICRKAVLVSTGKLVEYLSSLVDLQEDMERWKVEELSRLQDPTGDIRCVDQQLFIWVGVEMVVAKEENKLGVMLKEEKEIRNEENYLRHQLYREEHSVLMMTSAVAEKQVATLTMKLGMNRRKETSLERELVKAGSGFFEELNELKIMTRRLEEKKDSLRMKDIT